MGVAHNRGATCACVFGLCGVCFVRAFEGGAHPHLRRAQCLSLGRLAGTRFEKHLMGRGGGMLVKSSARESGRRGKGAEERV